MIDAHSVIDVVLARHAAALGADHDGYRNHVYCRSARSDGHDGACPCDNPHAEGRMATNATAAMNNAAPTSACGPSVSPKKSASNAAVLTTVDAQVMLP